MSFATITGVGFGGNNHSADAGAGAGAANDDDDVKEEDDNSIESSTSSEKMLDDMEAQWMRMESRKRAETIEVTSFERRLREIREKRRNSATEIRMAREMGSSFADESKADDASSSLLESKDFQLYDKGGHSDSDA